MREKEYTGTYSGVWNGKVGMMGFWRSRHIIPRHINDICLWLTFTGGIEKNFLGKEMGFCSGEIDSDIDHKVFISIATLLILL
jgi:hypothetical protein